MIEWADNPPEWQFSRYAYSAEDFEELQEQSIADRRAFLLNAAMLEMGRRGISLAEEIERSEEPEETPIEFRVPRRSVLTLRDTEAVAAIHSYHSFMAGKPSVIDMNSLKHEWRELAYDYGFLNGFGRNSHKFSDGLYVTKQPHPRFKYTEQDLIDKAEERFERLLTWTGDDVTNGFSARFLLVGIAKIEDACLDLDSLDAMLQDQRQRDEPDAYLNKRRINFWQHALDAKREFEVAGPYSDKVQYADSVDEIVPGVYTAPYIDPAVIATRKYVTLDDWHRAGLSTDRRHSIQKLTRGFNDVMSMLTGERDWQNPYRSTHDPLNRNAAMFFKKSLLLKVAKTLEWKKSGRHLKDSVEFLISEMYQDDDGQLDEERLQIMLGTTQARLSRAAVEAAHATFREVDN